jgi:photosystem II stability/assembly factor-like uncharacterized protein
MVGKFGAVVLTMALSVVAGTSTVSAAPASTSPASGTFAYLWPVGAQTAWLVVDTAEGGERVLRTTDGAASWDDVTPRQLSALVTPTNVDNSAATPQVVFLGAERAWTNAGGILVATSDGGRIWHDIGRVPEGGWHDIRRDPLDCGLLQFVDPTHGWCAMTGAAMGSEGIQLYRTVDGGLHWQRVSVTGPSSLPPTPTSTPGSLPFVCDKAISFTSPTVGWAGLTCAGNLEDLYETTDGGGRWVARTIAAMPPSLALGGNRVDPPVLTGRFGAGVINPGDDTIFYRSENGGASWQAVVPPGGIRAWYADVINALQWRLADNRRILATDNGGRTWRTITPHWVIPPANPKKALGGIQFVTPEIGWAQYYDETTDTTTLLRTTDGGRNWTEVRY